MFLPICSGACAWYTLRNKYENGKYSAVSEQEYNNSKIPTRNVQKTVKEKPLEKSE
mgnify:CR=1 FL=1